MKLIYKLQLVLCFVERETRCELQAAKNRFPSAKDKSRRQVVMRFLVRMARLTTAWGEDWEAPGWSKFPSWDFWRIQFDEDVCRWVPSFSMDGWKLMLLDEQCNVEIRADEGGYDDGGGYEGGGGWRMLACGIKSGQLFIAWLISEMSSKVWRF